MMQDRTFRGQSADGVWHEGFLIRSPGVKNSRPGEGWYINSEQEPAYAHLVKPFTIGMSTGVKDMEVLCLRRWRQSGASSVCRWLF